MYSLLRELGQRHKVTFVCYTVRKSVPPETREALTPYTTQAVILSEKSHPEPWLVRAVGEIPFVGIRARDRWRKQRTLEGLKRAVRDFARKEDFDVVLCGGGYTVEAAEGLKLPMVIDFCDTSSARYLGEMRHAPLIRRPVIFLRYLATRRSEIKAAHLTPHVTFSSERDRNALLGPAATCEILQQGIDYDYWRASGVEHEENCVVFTGAMDYSPNDDGAHFLIKQVLPLVRKAVPNIKTLIVGRDPLPGLIEAAKPLSDVTVSGTVPDVRPYLERASVYVAPLRFASGVQNKVVEAMAMGLPVVTTPVVADGLVWDGALAPVIVVKQAFEIAEQIVRLLNDAEERARLGQSGREFVVKHCSWSRSAEKLERMCVAAIETYPAKAKSLLETEKQCA